MPRQQITHVSLWNGCIERQPNSCIGLFERDVAGELTILSGSGKFLSLGRPSLPRLIFSASRKSFLCAFCFCPYLQLE